MVPLFIDYETGHNGKLNHDIKSNMSSPQLESLNRWINIANRRSRRMAAPGTGK